MIHKTESFTSFNTENSHTGAYHSEELDTIFDVAADNLQRYFPNVWNAITADSVRNRPAFWQ